MVDDEPEQRRSMFGEISIDGIQGCLHVFAGLLGVEKVGVDDLEECRIELHRLRNHFAVREAPRLYDLDSGECIRSMQDP